ncbi:Jag N-terminal domain-containing protein [Sulfurimonas sp. MAG313]|nr:Jag N-terminal domain-containing protein [Sulfurimonas sp. MAG313]MDF1881604.1 Jag N-terminal domain-containing protein [Sulfurimonas sp. MAG313]
MVKIHAETLESAYSLAAEKLSCSITQLHIEVIQTPSKGFLGLFKKQAIIVATSKTEVKVESKIENAPVSKPVKELQKKVEPEPKQEDVKAKTIKPSANKPAPKKKAKPVKEKTSSHNGLMMPASFVTDQEDDYDGSELYSDDDDEVYIGEETEICDKSHDEIHEQLASGITPSKKTQVVDEFFKENKIEELCKPSEVAHEIKEKIDGLFEHACFEIDEIKVCEHDDKTILVEFTGKDAALLIGKEGYRYKALSYMLYNWINAKYQLQLRLEIAEFLKNQEEMIAKYLEGVYQNINRDGKAQTKILDGVLVQIALRKLRLAYPDKYVAIRSTRDGAKFIIINSFNNDSNKY